MGVLGVYGKLIKSFTSLIRGIFPIKRHFHTHFWLTLKCRQFCVVFIKGLYLKFYFIPRADIYRVPNRPINEQLCSFNFCLKMLVRSSNFRLKLWTEAVGLGHDFIKHAYIIKFILTRLNIHKALHIPI